MVSGRWAVYQTQPGKDAVHGPASNYHLAIFLMLQCHRFLNEKTL